MVDSKQQIVMLPYMAQGHLIPFLSLARKLQESTSFTIIIATTPLNIKYLKNSTNQESSPQIQFQALPFNGADYGLPPNVENTESLPLSKIANLLHSSSSLKKPFQSFIAELVTQNNGHPPVCIISDLFMGWANDVADSFGTKNVTFTTGGAYGTAAYISIWLNLPHRFTSEDEFKVPGFPDSCRFDKSQLHPFVRAADGKDTWSQFFQTCVSNSLDSFGMLCNTVEEIEPAGLDILRKYVKMPVWCMGPLLPSRMLQISKESRVLIGKHSGREPGLPTDKCLDWLDLHSESSVLYISFGSQNTISPSQMMALALGLQESEKPFIWCIRPPIGFGSKDEFNPEWLPKGFEETVREENRGLLVYNWAPQLEILCHKSISSFLSHCGWNSVMESLSQGVPIIGWPLAGEQSYNSKMLAEEMGVAMELNRGTERCLEKDDVKKVLDVVMDNNNGGGKGMEMKRKAVEIGELIRGSVIGNGSSSKSLDDFISAVREQDSNSAR